MKILLVNENRDGQSGGVEYYRMLKPNHVLRSLKRFEGQFEFTSVNGITIGEDVVSNDGLIINDEWLSQFDLVHFCRGIAPYPFIEQVCDRLTRLNIPFGLDLDDYWKLPTNHQLYNHYKNWVMTEAIIKCIRESLFITTTTPILRDEIAKLNPNVYVLENGIDLLDPIWEATPTSDIPRFGFMQGTTHLEGIKMVAPAVKKLLNEKKYEGKFQIKLAGFWAQPNMTEPSIPMIYESMLTDYYKTLRFNPPYQEYLKQYTPLENDKFNDFSYQRIWAVGVKDFGKCYDQIDISVIPLVDDKFNACKSELKLLEAGFKGRAAIVSNVKPYTLLANDKNSFLINKTDSWYLTMKYCIDNPNAVEDKAQQLRYDVIKNYSLQGLADKRAEVYKKYGRTI